MNFKEKRIVNTELLRFIRTLPCVACSKSGPSDGHHVKTKKSGGDDVVENVIPLCRQHHQLWHLKGASFMSQNFQSVKHWLIKAGWKYDLKDFKWRKE